MCAPKRRFYDEFRKLVERVAKSEVNPDTIILMDLLTSISNQLKPINCTLRTGELWKNALQLLEKAKNTNDIVMMKKYLEKVKEVVEKLVEEESRWGSRVVSLLVLVAALSLMVKPLSLVSYVPWASLLLYQLSPTLSLLALFVGGLVAFYASPLLGALYVAASVVGGIEPPIRVDTEVGEVAFKVNMDELKRLFVEYYGEREGEELFRFELYQLVLSGKTEEEALAELWKRLTSTKIPSKSEGSGREHVSSGRQDERAQDSNEARDHG